MTTDRAVSDDALAAAVAESSLWSDGFTSKGPKYFVYRDEEVVSEHPDRAGMEAALNAGRMRAALRAASPFLAGDGVAPEKIAHVAKYLADMIVAWDAGAARNAPLPASIIEESLSRFFALSAPPPQPEVAGLVEAARDVLASWRNGGEQERFVPRSDDWDALGGYWSPAAAMVDSSAIAKLRAALASMDGGPK